MSEIDTLRAMLECMSQVSRFWGALDERDFKSLASMFTQDGVWNRPMGVRLAGRAEVLKLMEGRKTTISTCHLVSNLDCRPQGGHMEVFSMVTTYRHDDGIAVRVPAPLKSPHRILSVRDELVKTSSGWLFRLKDVKRVFNVEE